MHHDTPIDRRVRFEEKREKEIRRWLRRREVGQELMILNERLRTVPDVKSKKRRSGRVIGGSLPLGTPYFAEITSRPRPHGHLWWSKYPSIRIEERARYDLAIRREILKGEWN